MESVGNNLSNFEKIIPLVITKASDLRGLWRDGSYETKRKIEYLVYPNGIFWDKKKRSYRTENRNAVFDLLDGFSAGYENEIRTASNEAVPLCGIVEDYRTFAEDFKRVLESVEWLEDGK